MSNNASPKPFKQRILALLRQPWLSWLLLPLVFVAVSAWLTRSMLSNGEVLPALSVQKLDGTPVQLAWQQPSTLVYAFAPWCGVCRLSMPSLNLLDAEQVRIVALAFDYDSAQQVAEYIRDIGYDGEVYLADAKVFHRLKLSGYPSYYLVAKDGEVRHKDRGFTTPPGLWWRLQRMPG